MSQQALADKMREAGFDWAQATVWSVEKGKRPLRLAEAEAVAKIFGFDLNALTTHTSWYTLFNHATDLQRANMALWQAAENYEATLRTLVEAADEMVAEGVDVDEITSMMAGYLEPDYMDRANIIVGRRMTSRHPVPGGGPFAKMHKEKARNGER